MKTITIGNRIDTKAAVKLDVQKLILTRLLILANSGGGKSWLVRLLAEQLYAQKIPVIIIDPEGEFSTLREKFDFVLVGKGGETPADVRSAKLVMHKLLELRASAIFDLSELPIDQKVYGNRHEYVRLISEAAIESPKNLWRPTAFIFDEVQTFCPENGKGESVAKGAVIGFPTRGRKRQFLSIFATQRSAKLAMDARAEFLNRIIGMTFEPDDLKIAASILGVSGRDETKDFNLKMRTMDEGNFYAFGRAIPLETILFKSGMIQTSHGVGSSNKYSTKAPPTPDAIKKLLPKLEDLPKEAEAKEQSEKQMRDEIRRLTTENRQLKTTQPKTSTVEKKIEVEVAVPFFNKEERAEIRKVETDIAGMMIQADKLFSAVIGGLTKLEKVAHGKSKFIPARALSPKPIAPLPQRVTTQHSAPPAPPAHVADISTTDFKPTKCQKAILNVLHQFEAGCQISKLAMLALYKVTGSFRTELSGLRAAGAIVGENSDAMRITAFGTKFTGNGQTIPADREGRFNFFLNHPAMTKCQRAIMHVLNNHTGEGLLIDELAAQCEPPYNVTGSFRTELSGLRTMDVITGKNTDRMKLNAEFFE